MSKKKPEKWKIIIYDKDNNSREIPLMNYYHSEEEAMVKKIHKTITYLNYLFQKLIIILPQASF